MAIQRAQGAGCRLAIRSNELDLFYGAEFRGRLPMLQGFDVIVDATYSGILKPDPRAYQDCLDRLGLAIAASMRSAASGTSILAFPGGAFHAPDGLAAFAEALRAALEPRVELIELAGHINDTVFAEAALTIFDRWRADGTIS